MKHVFVHAKPDVDLKVFRQLVNQANQINLSTGNDNPVSVYKKIYPRTVLKHLHFTFLIVCTYEAALELSASKVETTTLESTVISNATLVLATSDIDYWITYCKTETSEQLQQTLRQIEQNLKRLGYSEAFLWS